jgi:heat shock protein HtpX
MRKFSTAALMFAVAIGISITLGFLFELFGLAPYFQEQGLNYQSLLLFCLIFGFAGSFISLLLSKRLVKWSMKIELIDPSTAQGDLRWYYDTVKRHADQAGLPKTPEVGIYHSPELNAFATGPTQADALVAVSTGLLSSMTRDEVEGVIGHEVAHIANGDMVRMALMQGIVNTLIMFIARAAAYIIASRMERDSWGMRLMLTLAFEMVLGIFGMMVVTWYSRKREFRADAGGSSLAGRHKMIAALEALRDRSRVIDDRQPQLATMKISGKTSGFARFFMTHPPLDERIAALKRGL